MRVYTAERDEEYYCYNEEVDTVLRRHEEL